ncbi:MAG TPA: hypothetical protein VGQ65_03065 [Thermoanaerobaculia bacterium]|nr:hypothetical protein [Thermoanaerobaculia bacterium]
MYEISSPSRLWPEETSIHAVVFDSAGHVVGEAILKDVVLRAPAWFGLLMALIGAAIAAFVRIGFTHDRTLSSVLYGLLGILFAGILAWVAVETNEVWSFFGFEKPPLRTQSYLLLGLALGAFNPRKLLSKLTQESEDEALTARQVQKQITELLTTENLRKPFREELEQMLFDEKYVSEQSPAVIGRLEVGLLAAKNKVKLPADLSNYLSPRLTRMYLGSYRRNFEATWVARIESEAKQIVWKRRTYYEYVRNDARPSSDPEVTSIITATIPMPLREQSSAALRRFGPVMRSITFSIRDFDGGPPLKFEGSQGTQLHPMVDKDGGPATHAPVDVGFEYDDRAKSVEAKFSFAFPEAFRAMRVVSVVIESECVGELTDGLAFLRVAQPTFRYSASLQFEPKLPHNYDIAVFEWKEQGRDTTSLDEETGAVQLTGWLMPGNGVCIAWRGTTEGSGSVSGEVAAGPSLAQTVLRFLRWRKRT